MANTLTNLIPELYSNLDVVSRELVGMVPAVTLDATTSRAAVGQTVRSFVAPAVGSSPITPGVTPPDDGNQTIGNVELAITKAKRVAIRWNGEQEVGINTGPGAQAIRASQIQQAFRTLANEIEADLAGLYVAASRAHGTAGATPFGTAGDYSAASFTRKILVDNGAPNSDLQMVLDTGAGANLRGKQASSSQEFGDSLLRQGVLLDINGMAVRESGQILTHTAGAMASATTTAATLTVGQTVLPLATAGTGQVAAGDVITLANDTNQYVVTSVSFASTNPAAGDSITIAAPGIRRAQGSATRLITVVGSSVRSMAFHRSAIVLAQRLPALPAGGDLAVDRTTVTDPRSGLSFEVAMYPQYRQMQWEISCAWGVKLVKPEHAALLLG
jgi:hypothetical protein